MSEDNHVNKVQVESIISRAVHATPGWVLGLCGGMVTLSVCLIAVLQLGGFTPPLQRIMNAKATEIERAAESLTASATTLELLLQRVSKTEDRVVIVETRLDKVEQRLDGVDRYHKLK